MDYEIYNCSIKAMTLCPTNEKHNICIVDAIRLCTPNPKCECKSVIDNLMPLYTTAIIVLPIVLVFFFLKSIFERYRLFKEERNLHLGQIGDGKYSTVIEMNNVAI